MAKQPVQSITSLEESPDDDRRRRMLRYSLAMGIRMVCVILLFFVHGWWLLVVIVGAIVLPYVAVVIANTSARRTGAPIESPDRGAIVLRDPTVYRPTVIDPPSGDGSA